MSDVRIPMGFKLGDAVVTWHGENKNVGIIIELLYYGDHGDVALVYWPSGVANVSCATLYPAFT